jgi:hypothetical protein
MLRYFAGAVHNRYEPRCIPALILGSTARLVHARGTPAGQLVLQRESDTTLGSVGAVRDSYSRRSMVCTAFAVYGLPPPVPSNAVGSVADDFAGLRAPWGRPPPGLTLDVTSLVRIRQDLLNNAVASGDANRVVASQRYPGICGLDQIAGVAGVVPASVR